MRPNIRVEIQNNLVEPMEVEEEQEEGEIPDEDKDETSNSSSKHSLKSPGDVPYGPYPVKGPSSFAMGIDLFDKHEMEKLQKRAQRFQLKPDEIKNFTDEELALLKKSLGITFKNEVNVRPEAIMMHGLDQMTPEDILDYFLKYAPVSLEWLNEESCNVVWQDKLTAARALHFMSKPVRGMPVRNGCSYVDGLNEVDGETGESALFKNANREVELQEDMEVTEKPELEGAVDISEVPGSIPPGYWRLGTKHPKSKCLLLRFSLKTDMQPFKVELLSRYFKSHAKKYGKEEPKHSGIFERNKAIKRPGATAAEANPWSELAENWDEDVNFRERERMQSPEEEKVEIKSQSLKVRLGSKRKESDDSDSEKSEEVVKRTKIPRMRMYADEEEEKIKKKKLLNTINQTMKKIESDEVDLRRVLSTSNRKPAEVKVEETFDLGTKLKSRRQKMMFEVKTEPDESERRRLAKENARSSRYSARSISPPRYRRSPERDHRSRRRSRSRQSRRYDDEDDDYYRRDKDVGKPKSKVAVVIKTAKRPAVASAVGATVWSRINRPSSSSSESESGSKSSSGSSSEEEESEDEEEEEEGEEEEEEEEEEVEEEVSTSSRTLFSDRPGFRVATRKLNQLKAPLKIEISNDHFNKKRK